MRILGVSEVLPKEEGEHSTSVVDASSLAGVDGQATVQTLLGMSFWEKEEGPATISLDLRRRVFVAT